MRDVGRDREDVRVPLLDDARVHEQVVGGAVNVREDAPVPVVAFDIEDETKLVTGAKQPLGVRLRLRTEALVAEVGVRDLGCVDADQTHSRAVGEPERVAVHDPPERGGALTTVRPGRAYGRSTGDDECKHGERAQPDPNHSPR